MRGRTATSAVFPWLPPPMNFPGKALLPGFAIPALASPRRPNAIGPKSIFQVEPAPFLGNCDPTRASTAHTSGMQVGLADGSVRTLAPSMSGDDLVGRRDAHRRRSAGSDW